MARDFRKTFTLVGVVVAAVLLGACDDGDGDETSSGEAIEIAVSPSGLPLYVAADQGFFGDEFNIEVSQVGYDQSAALFLAGDSPIGWISPLEVADFVAEGEEFRYLSTAGGSNMINGLVVREEDKDKYQTLEDLVDVRVGNPGFGTATWSTLQVVAESQYGINPREEFDNVTADSGALLGMLESGEIDAALLFSGQSAAALAQDDQFETMFSFTEAWQESTGEPMVVNGPVVRVSWLDEHPEEAETIIKGLDEAVQWMIDNPQELQEGGAYEEWANAEGWLSSPETTEGIIKLLQDGEWYLTSEDYDEAWIDSMYELIKAGEGVLVDEAPPKEEIFHQPGGGA